MKKFSPILAVLAMFAAAVACTPEQGGSQGGGKVKSIEFSASAPAFSLGPKFKWDAQDKIGVFVSSEAYVIEVLQEGSAVKAKGDVMTSEKYFAVTPYLGTETCTDGYIMAEVPSTQEAVKDGISYEALVGVAKTNSTELAFKSAVGLIKMEISKEEGVRSITLKSKGTESLSGQIKINAETAKASIVGGNNSVVLSSDNGLGTGVYYASVIPATYVDGMEITLTDEYGRVFSFPTDEFTSVKAGAVLDLGAIDESAEFKTPSYEPVPANLAFKGDGETLQAELPVQVKGDIEYKAPSWVSSVQAEGKMIVVTAGANTPVQVEDAENGTRAVDDVRYGVVEVSGVGEDGPFTATIYIAQAAKGAKLIYDSFRGTTLQEGWKGNLSRSRAWLDGEGLHMVGSGDQNSPYALYWMSDKVRQKYNEAGDCNSFICSIDIKADTGCAGIILFNKYGYDTDYNYSLDHQFYRAWSSANKDDNSGGFYCFNSVSPNAMDNWTGDLSSGWYRLMISNTSWSKDVQPDWGGKYIWSLKEDENGVLQRDQLLLGGEGGMWWWNDSPQLGMNYGYFGVFSKDTNEMTVRNFTLSFTDK